MELIYRHSEEWHCDVNRIAIIGFSAGGHLAAYYSINYDCHGIREVFPASKPVKASILCYPVITADPTWAHVASIEALTGKEQFTEEEILKYSCDKQVHQNTPPTFLWHTASDGLVPIMNSILYSQTLATKGIPFELHIFPNGKPGLATGDSQTIDSPNAVHSYNHRWLFCAKNGCSLFGKYRNF